MAAVRDDVDVEGAEGAARGDGAARAEAPSLDTGLVQVLDADGRAARPIDLEPALLLRAHRLMVTLRVLDRRALNLQRQGRITFYAPSLGQEAAVIGSALALEPQDWCYPTYREAGACLTRGLSLRAICDQLFGNAADLTRGRQMPNHFACERLKILSISSCIATQVPQAAGTGMAQRMRGERAATICYLGDGGTSEGDTHAGLNFAGVFRASTVFFVQNNQWAITVPCGRQTASATIAIKARAYGFPGVRVDGNDLVAVYETVRAALERARAGEGPTLIEALTYRMGAHSTSDDPRRYRPDETLEPWRRKDPIARLERYLGERGLLDEAAIAARAAEAEEAVGRAIEDAERTPPPSPESVFEDVRGRQDARLAAQQQELVELIERGVVRRVTGLAH